MNGQYMSPSELREPLLKSVGGVEGVVPQSRYKIPMNMRSRLIKNRFQV